MTVVIKLHQVVDWSLRYFGLAPGQALANARPGAADRRQQQLEQWAYIQTRFGTGPRPAPDPSRLPPRRREVNG